MTPHLHPHESPDRDVKPVRLQLKRTRGFDLQKLSLATNGLPAVNVSRPGPYGNRFTVKEYGSAEMAVAQFEHDVQKFACFHSSQYAAWIKPLIGKNVACSCGLDAVCHGDVLLALAAEEAVLYTSEPSRLILSEGS